MTIFRFIHRVEGAHVRVLIFSAPDASTTFARIGEMTLRPAEWTDFRALLIRVGGGVERTSATIDVEAGEPVTTYYDTLAQDLHRAKEMISRGDICGGDVFAAYKLLESFVAEIERGRRG